MRTQGFHFMFVQTDDEPRVIPPIISSRFRSTSIGSHGGSPYFQVTSNGTQPSRHRHFVELHALRSATGLTWKQLAKLFGIDVRMVHYWLDAERPMSSAHADILNRLSAIAIKCDLPAFRVRKLFEILILPKSEILNRIHSSDLMVFSEIALHFKLQRMTYSDPSIADRLPALDPVTLMSPTNYGNTLPRMSKGRRARISRPHKS